MNNTLNDIQNQIMNLHYRLDTINNEINQDCKNEINDLKKSLFDIEYKLQQIELFNNKVNQAYVNNEVANINNVQKIDKLENSINKFNDLHEQYSSLFTSIDGELVRLDKKIDDVSNDQDLIFQALLNLQQTFDTFNEMLTKERIMNTSIITALTVELLSTGVLNGNNYINKLHDVVNQILTAYKSMGCDIDFSQELESIDSRLVNGVVAVHIPQVLDTNEQKTIQKEITAKDKGIIKFQDILKQKNKLHIDEAQKNNLYAEFQNKLNNILSKKKNKKDDENKKK